MKTQGMAWEVILANQIFDKGLYWEYIKKNLEMY